MGVNTVPDHFPKPAIDPSFTGDTLRTALAYFSPSRNARMVCTTLASLVTKK